MSTRNSLARTSLDARITASGANDATSPAMRVLYRYLALAADQRASDIHFEPGDDGLSVRLRIDGILRQVDPPPASLIDAMIVRLRLLARIDLAEQRLPQDGRFVFGRGEAAIDVRAAFMPVDGGEKIALRLMRGRQRPIGFSELGLASADAEALHAALDRPRGLIVTVGPTGSGKSTTLYAALEQLRRPQISIVTVEDPIERRMAGIAQIAVDEDCGRTFSAVLRSILRQDPDVIMIGEMRDADSARIACRAALTGHRVLTSLHTADTREALVRLVDMGVADYLVDATLSLIVAQRLLRELCPHCKVSAPVGQCERSLFDDAGVPVPGGQAHAVGCPSCGGEGYRGRIAIFEVLDRSNGGHGSLPPQRSLMAAGLSKVAMLETTLSEVAAHCPRPEQSAA